MKKIKSNILNQYSLIEPHLIDIGESLQKISKIIKVKQTWCLVDLYYKTDGKKFLIDEFRMRKI